MQIDSIKKLSKPFREPEPNVYVDTTLTPEEMLEKQRIRELRLRIKLDTEELDRMLAECKHEVKQDEANIMYDFRHCFICMKHLETI